MRRTKRFAGFALAACMGVSLLVNVPAGTVLAEEPTEMVVADIAETSEADFEWDDSGWCKENRRVCVCGL